MKLFKGLDLSVRDSMDSNLHWVNLLFSSMILNCIKKIKALKTKLGESISTFHFYPINQDQNAGNPSTFSLTCAFLPWLLIDPLLDSQGFQMVSFCP